MCTCCKRERERGGSERDERESDLEGEVICHIRSISVNSLNHDVNIHTLQVLWKFTVVLILCEAYILIILTILIISFIILLSLLLLPLTHVHTSWLILPLN